MELEIVKFVEQGLLLHPVCVTVELQPQGSFKTTSVQQGFTAKYVFDIFIN